MGVFFNRSYPKNHKYGEKFKYQNWSYPKIHKYGKKLKYRKLETFYLPKKHLELLGGDQLRLRTFRGGPV